MTEETNTPTEEAPTQEETPEEVTKLPIDDPSDFIFHAAYMAYSETWEKITAPDIRNELNGILTSLSKEEISYSNFYKTLDDYRRQGSKHYEFSRDRIETQRKRDWRQKSNKEERNSRYRGKR